MTELDLPRVIELALSTLSDRERRSSAVYLDTRQLEAPETIVVGRKEIASPGRGYLAFVDPAPTANWGHPCRYVLVESATGRMHEFPAQFPPFLRDVAPTLRLIWKGSEVPDTVLPELPGRKK